MTTDENSTQNENGDLGRSEFHNHGGRIMVSLDRPTFDRVFKALQENANISELSEVEPNQAWQIVVQESSHFAKATPPSWWWKDRLWLFGCGVIAFTVVFLMLMGLLAVVGLLPLPR